MSDLIPFNSKYLLPVAGFRNNGVLCHLNSLVQCLGSCPSFWQTLVKYKSKYEADPKKYKIENSLLGIRSRIVEHINKQKGTNFSAPGDCTDDLLTAIRRQRKDHELPLDLMDGEQECMHNGLHAMIDVMGREFKNLFSIRYDCIIRCKSCKHETIKEDESNYVLNLFEEEKLIQDSLTSKQCFEKYIKNDIQLPDDDYKCDKCKSHNTTDPKTKHRSGPISKVYSLKLISEIIVIAFPQYNEKKKFEFPDELEFKASNNKILRYQVVAVGEHSGTRHGGHYTAKGLRKNPDGFEEDRLRRWNEHKSEQKNKIKTSIEETKAKLKKKIIEEKAKDGGGSTSRISIMRKRITELDEELKDQMKELEKEIEKKDSLIKKDSESGNDTKTWSFNDTRIAPCVDGFVRNPKVIIVFYHLMDEYSPYEDEN